MDNKFDDIRPYYDSEIPEAMQRIAKDPLFPILSSYVFPEKTSSEVAEMVRKIKTIREFQLKIMNPANKAICRNSISKLSYSGFENINPGKAYIYLSNHRDIMLDAALLQTILIDNGLETTEITFGANLMQGQLVIDVGKSNKMFKVERPGGNMRDFFRASVHLSDYMRTCITQRKESMWIAQRNGRTKDGVDRTDQGIINMFRMSAPKDMSKTGSVAELHLLPVAISYEWEPCDIAKVLELYTRSLGPYTKKPGEDLTSIITGITAYKGRVHIHFCPEITAEDLEPYESLSSAEFNRQTAALADSRICPEYRLWPNNYIAHDLLHGSRAHSEFYTPEEEAALLKYMDKLEEYGDVCDLDSLRSIMLGIYAGPVDSKEIFSKDKQ